MFLEGGGAVLGSVFAGYVLLVSQGPYPIIVYSVANNIIDSILVVFGPICNFHDPNLVRFYLRMYLKFNEVQFTFHQ